MTVIDSQLALKLAAILDAQQGWDYESSLPVDRRALANYMRWVADVPSDRAADAEPMLTDEGFIRLEWDRDRGRIDHTVEIGPEMLWLCVLCDEPDECIGVEAEFSVVALDRFFRFSEFPEVDL